MKLISRSDIRRILSVRETIELTRDALVQLSTNRAIIPDRVALSLDNRSGVTLFMPGYLRNQDAMAIKIVSVHGNNPQKHLPLIHALIVLIDPATGVPLAAMEGGLITAMRTGAASGVATDLLAVKDAATAAIFGAGVQARSQLLSIIAVRPIRRCLVYAPRREKVESFLAEIRNEVDPSIEVVSADSPSQAVRESQIICTATTSSSPVFNGTDLRPGTHINAVGSFKPEVREIDFESLRRAGRIVVDTVRGALAEAGEIIQALDHGVISRESVQTEIGEIAAGLKPGRTDDGEITIFKSVGNAAVDVAVAKLVFDRAFSQNLGADVDILA